MDKRTIQINCMVSPSELDKIIVLSDLLHCSRSQVLRAAMHNMYAQRANIPNSSAPPPPTLLTPAYPTHDE